MSKIITDFEELKEYQNSKIPLYVFLGIKIVPISLSKLSSGDCAIRDISNENSLLAILDEFIFENFTFFTIDKVEDAPEIFNEVCEIIINKIKKSFKDVGF